MDELNNQRQGFRRCSLHNINYPPHVLRCMVDGCNIYLSWFDDGPYDPEWRQQLEYHNDNQVARSVAYKVIDPADKHLGHHALPDVQFNVALFEGHEWVPHEELIKAGYRNLEDFQVVKIRGRFYELQAHIGRTLTHGIKGGAWWVEEIDLSKIEIPDYIPKGGELNGEEEDAD